MHDAMSMCLLKQTAAMHVGGVSNGVILQQKLVQPAPVYCLQAGAQLLRAVVAFMCFCLCAHRSTA
jgi:hypothetical protein